MKQEIDTKVFALGGLGEVGKNMPIFDTFAKKYLSRPYKV